MHVYMAGCKNFQTWITIYSLAKKHNWQIKNSMGVDQQT